MNVTKSLFIAGLTMMMTAGIATTAAVTTMVTTTMSVPAFAYVCPQKTCVDEGRMTGKGIINATGDVSVIRHDFDLNCERSEVTQELEIRWGRENRFELENLHGVNCFDDPKFNSTQTSVVGFDTLEAVGNGSYNGQSGAFIWVQFADGGETRRNDWATVVIYDKDEDLVLDITGNLLAGNLEAEKR